jgi:hypothetical protein
MHPLPLDLIVLSGSPLFSRGHAPLRTGAGAAISSRACQGCHEEIYAQWERSRHAQAWSNALFTASFGDQGRSSWCVHCHAPLVEQRTQAFLGEPPGTPLLQEGVNCAACHIREGRILTAQTPSLAAREAHPVRHEPELRTADFCGGCHEFHLPDRSAPGRPDTPLLMQQTLKEWRASEAASRGETCQACHMAGGSHTFPGSHNLEFVRGALEIDWRWSGPSTVCAVLRARNVGHAIPTGDPFRRLRLRVCQDEACTPPLGQRYLSREISWVGEEFIERPDSRLAPPPAPDRTECFELPQGTLASSWKLEFLYAEPRIEGQLPESVSRAFVSGGPLPPSSLRSAPRNP